MKKISKKSYIITGSILVIMASFFLFGFFQKTNKEIKKKVIFSSEAPKAIGPYSQAIQYGDMLFISGQLGIQPKTGELAITLEDQTKQAMQNLKVILEEGGMSFKDVVQTHIFLKDIKDFQKVNEIYAKYFDGDFPARATMQVAALPKDGKIEIEMIACKSK